jgi:YaiO family outer membrane protein
MKKVSLLMFSYFLACALAAGQSNSSATVAPGSSLPGLGGLSLGLNGPGYIEVGGSHSSLTNHNTDWNDFYVRGTVSGGRNVINGELTREARFGDSGWYYGMGLTRTVSEEWYMQVSAAGSAGGGFFLPRFSSDAILNRKLLRSRQLVVTAGMGFDQSKTVDNDVRGQIGAAYYFQFPVILQGGVMWTHATPGDILARTQYIAATEGHDKEHFFSLRYEWGREGYEVIGGPSATAPAFNVLFDFPMHNATATWRQWIGPNWGFNLDLEQHQETAYHRIGGTFGIFLNF